MMKTTKAPAIGRLLWPGGYLALVILGVCPLFRVVLSGIKFGFESLLIPSVFFLTLHYRGTCLNTPGYF